MLVLAPIPVCRALCTCSSILSTVSPSASLTTLPSLFSLLAKIVRELEEAGAKVVVAVKELEAWILAGLCYSNAEKIPDPSWELRRAKGVLKSEHTYREIAASLDLELYRCKPLS